MQISRPAGSRSNSHSGLSVAMTTTQALASFATYQKGRAFSPHTIRRRQTSLASIARYIDPLPLLAATPDLVEEWLGTFVTPRTKHAYRSDLSSFFAWAVKRQLVERSPMEQVDSIRVPKGLPHPVPVELVRPIIDAAPTVTLRLTLALAAYAGLRRAEISVLTPDDVAMFTDPPTLTVRDGKWGQDRSVPLHPTLGKLLAAHQGRGRYVPLQPDTVGKMAADHMRGLGFDFTIHQLRATFATELARATAGNVILVAKMLGHGSIQTTMGYVGWSGGEGGAAISSMYAA
jgi:integrase